MVNLTNLLYEIWDLDNSTTKKRATNNEVKVLITKWQIMNFFLKKINFLKRTVLLEGNHKKNNKVKYSTIKQFKNKTMQIKYGIRK
jgi:hypothetical protein